MTIRLYFDEDAMDRDVLGPLRLRGIDLETATDAGMLERDDEEQLAYAASQGRVIVTSNAAHFANLHRHYLETGRTHAGIIVIHQQRFTTGEVIRRLLRLVGTRTADAMRDQLEYLSSKSFAGD
ncbi:MAG: DUF5615 family PIN-like protein [Chloroflexi bacterium]|nr:DUF5615 family PIN-like protein [Chloroflexota bacterium]